MPNFLFPPADNPLDVLIVGAGLSGIGAAYVLQQRCPTKRYAILEARAALGGTWDLFRYPGVRSDSDMHTLGYGARPWTDPQAIADGPAILRYIEDTAREGGIVPHIRFHHRVVSAEWSSAEACWTVGVAREGTAELLHLRTRFLYVCSGYYAYDEAHRPTFAGESDYLGRIVQPQFWPQDLDYAGQRVVVVGSGATAVTLVPAMAKTAAHVTMLQRSPTYIVTRPSRDKVADWLRRYLPGKVAGWLTRWKNVLQSIVLYRIARQKPDKARQQIVALAGRQLPAGYDVATHFTPTYNPWDQRVCVVPDGDLFRAIRKEQASVVTDEIDAFTPHGLRLKSGQELPADVVVLATGLKLKMLGGLQLTVDGQPRQPSELLSYKGMMLSSVPNFAWAFGYTNASWTLKADLTANYVCRLLRYMDRRHFDIVVARPGADVQPEPFLNFSSGYVQRAQELLPKQGSRRPWQVHQNYVKDLATIRWSRLADEAVRFGAKGVMP
jgi:monooxygenase